MSEGPRSLSMLPFKLVIPPPPRGRGRLRKRHPAKGLTLACTRIQPSRLQDSGLQNIAVELKDVAWGGVRFVASELLPVPCPLNLLIRREASGETLRAKGQTIWVESRQVNGRDVHTVGAKFDEILSPPSDCAWYFEGVVASQPKPWEAPAPKPALKPRRASRFAIPDCDLTLDRDYRFREPGKSARLESRLLDLSRSGAQVVCSEPVARGERVRLTVDFKKFNDIFTVEAESVWVRYPSTPESRDWRVGLAFGELSHAQLRQIVTFENWFRGTR